MTPGLKDPVGTVLIVRFQMADSNRGRAGETLQGLLERLMLQEPAARDIICAPDIIGSEADAAVHLVGSDALSETDRRDLMQRLRG